MKEITVTRDELKEMFKKKEIVDTGKGWFYKGKRVDLAAHPYHRTQIYFGYSQSGKL